MTVAYTSQKRVRIIQRYAERVADSMRTIRRSFERMDDDTDSYIVVCDDRFVDNGRDGVF